MAGPTPEFWQSRFVAQNTPWDRRATNPQLLDWIAQGLLPAGERVLVPGCGHGWEVAALAQHGADVTAIDYAPGAITHCAALLRQHGLQATLAEADVLNWAPVQPLDAVYEQACLCALHPDHWVRYAAQLHAWLRPGGQLLALFAQAAKPGAAQGFIEGPPYHCDIHAMRALFTDAHWVWPKPPYARITHDNGMAELVLILTRRAG
jgi:methyl halide transferase